MRCSLASVGVLFAVQSLALKVKRRETKQSLSDSHFSEHLTFFEICFHFFCAGWLPEKPKWLRQWWHGKVWQIGYKVSRKTWTWLVGIIYKQHSNTMAFNSYFYSNPFSKLHVHVLQDTTTPDFGANINHYFSKVNKFAQPQKTHSFKKLLIDTIFQFTMFPERGVRTVFILLFNWGAPLVDSKSKKTHSICYKRHKKKESFNNAIIYILQC